MNHQRAPHHVDTNQQHVPHDSAQQEKLTHLGVEYMQLGTFLLAVVYHAQYPAFVLGRICCGGFGREYRLACESVRSYEVSLHLLGFRIQLHYLSVETIMDYIILSRPIPAVTCSTISVLRACARQIIPQMNATSKPICVPR